MASRREALHARLTWVILAALLVLAALLRFYKLGERALTSDELWNLHVISRDWHPLLRLAATDTFPPLTYLLLKLWTLSQGTSDLALRAPAVAAGLASVPLVFLLGRTLVDRNTGLLAAGIFAVSGFWLTQAQDARLYSLTTMLCLASWWGFASWLWDGGGTNAFARWAAATLLALYTHYLCWPLLLGQNLALLAQRKPIERRWWYAQLAFVVAYVPWVLLLAHPGARAAGFFADRPASSLAFALRKLFNSLFEFGFGLASREHKGHLSLALSIAALLVVLLVQGKVVAPRRLWTCTWALAPVVLMVLAAGVARQVPFERYLAAPAGVLVLLWLAWALTAHPNLVARPLLLGVTLGLNVVSALVAISVPSWDLDFRPALRQLVAETQPGDTLVLSPPTDVLKVRRYLNPAALAELALPPETTFGDQAASDAWTDQALSRGGRIWLLSAPSNAPVVPGQATVDRLRRDLALGRKHKMGPLSLELYGPRANKHAR